MRHAAILIVLGAATAARAESGQALHLAVHGSVDTAVLGDALAHELGVDVALAGATCELPCLAITIDDRRTATVLYAPRKGPPRTRAVRLGEDPQQWPLVITLLAGNVVRDEAQDVLSQLPERGLPRGPSPGDVPAIPEISGDAPPAVETPPITTLAGAVPAARPAAPAAESAPREQRFLALGLVPGLSTDLLRIGSVEHSLSLHVLVGVSGGSSGLSMSGIADVERGPVSGAQLAGIAVAARKVTGTQAAGIAAVSGDVDGVQLAGIAAIGDRVDGAQLGGVAALARGAADGQFAGLAALAGGAAHTQFAGIATVAPRATTQAAGVAALAGGDSRVQVGGVLALALGDTSVQIGGVASAARQAGVQLAGVAAFTAGDARTQIGGVASAARGTVNVQVAGVVNVAGRVGGAQIAPINIARHVDGVQVGVINVGSAEGFSFGLINIVPGGRYDLEAAVDSSRTGTLLFRHGGRRWHNVYGVAGHPVDESTTRSSGNDDVWMYGLGFGPTLTFGDTLVDLEAISWEVNHGPRHESDISILGQLRLSIAHHWGAFAIVAGGVLNTYVTNDHASPLMLERRTSGSEMPKGVTVDTWPSAFVGVRI